MATPNTPAGSDAEHAMNRVLGAEHDAKTAVAECSAQAAAAVEQARQQARRIGERADHRISRLHTACELAAGQRIELLLQQERSADARRIAPPREEEVLDAAVERLAAMLTGAAPAQRDQNTE